MAHLHRAPAGLWRLHGDRWAGGGRDRRHQDNRSDWPARAYALRGPGDLPADPAGHRPAADVLPVAARDPGQPRPAEGVRPGRLPAGSAARPELAAIQSPADLPTRSAGLSPRRARTGSQMSVVSAGML